MRNRVLSSVLAAPALLICASVAVAGDWPQWRGPSRNGVTADETRLAERWPKAGPRKLWQSEEIPSHGKGGFSCISVADGRAYVYANWKYRDPIATRRLSPGGLKKLGWTNKKLPIELADAAEAARLSEQRAKLKGKELNKWAADWVKEKLTPEQQKQIGTYLKQRIRRGPKAISLQLLDKLAKIKGRTFASQQELDEWMTGAELPENVKKQVLSQIPTDVKKANDVVLCFDGADGTPLWRFQVPGRSTGWGSSSTPCVADGRVYVAGALGNVYCIDAKTGQKIWTVKRPGSPDHDVNSSILKVGEAIIVAGRPLTALKAKTGEVLWKQKKVASLNNSVSLWPRGDKTYLICNGAGGGKVACVDAADGNVLWTVAGGGSSSAVVAGDVLVVLSNGKAVGTSAYRMSEKSPSKLWTACASRKLHPGRKRGLGRPDGGAAGHDGRMIGVVEGAVHAWRWANPRQGAGFFRKPSGMGLIQRGHAARV